MSAQRSQRFLGNAQEALQYGQSYWGNAYCSSPMVQMFYPPQYTIPMNQPILTSTPNYTEIPNIQRQSNTKPQYYQPTARDSPDIETILRNQVQEYITLGLEKKLTDFQATKDSTKILKDWLKKHRHNPYPSKTEKVMLAYSAQMTMTQISNWFANARRRLKQERNEQRTSGKADRKPETTDYDNSSPHAFSGVDSCVSTSDKVHCSLADITAVDSGFESFIDVENESNDSCTDNQKDRKCKTNLFGTDPVLDVTVHPLEESHIVPKRTENNKQTVSTTPKIWSVVDILNQ